MPVISAKLDHIQMFEIRIKERTKFKVTLTSIFKVLTTPSNLVSNQKLKENSLYFHIRVNNNITYTYNFSTLTFLKTSLNTDKQ